MPARVESLEAEQKDLLERLASPALYADEPSLACDLQARHDVIESELMSALERWEMLGSR